ncbi:MAG: hypothetical protein AB1608_10305, partial [Thermoproteota archaeon]
VEIFKNFKIINEKYAQNQKIKKLSDSELISRFKNEIAVPNWVVNDRVSRSFNRFLSCISMMMRIIL